jgi:hypothetical protein
MPIWRNSSFNPISTSMSASQRRARSRTPWTISGETRHSDPCAGTNQETIFLRSSNTLPSRGAFLTGVVGAVLVLNVKGLWSFLSRIGR